MHRRLVRVALAIVPLLVVLAACEARDLPTVSRPYEPVVLTGAQVPSLQGIAPNRLVAYRFVYGTWQQQPVQVDERALLDLATPKHLAPTGVTARFYTDSSTWTGADPDPTLDADDEIAFMASAGFGQARSIDDPDRGVHYTLGDPPHVVAGSGVEVRLSDPLRPGSASWIYLFESDGTLDPGAGRPPAVDYDFVLLSGDYKTTYDIASGPNPENSVATASDWSAHFGDRWILDELHLRGGGATGVDILDLQKFAFIGTCTRSEYTFRSGPGAIIANRSGPVRAIRSLLGANSGTYTQRDYVMYADRMDVTTYLRVHAVPAGREWIDYSPAASGMQYLSSTTPGGVTIDGSPDTVSTAMPSWELVRGAQGSLVHTNRVDTDITTLPGNLTHWYSDTTTPTATEDTCTGDAFDYGASGTTMNQSLPNTDPTIGPANRLTSTRSMTFLGPDAPASAAQAIGYQATAPLALTFAPFSP